MMSQLANSFSIKRGLREKSLDICLQIANKIKDPNKVRQVVLSPENVSSFKKVHPWSDLSLSHGFPGTVILFAELDRNRPNEGWDVVVHHYLLAMKEALEGKGYSDLSLFGGLSGVAFAVMVASRNGERYQAFLTKVNEILVERYKQLVEGSRQYRLKKEGTAAQWYDVIVGISGGGRYFLSNSNQEEARETLKIILTELIETTIPIEIQGHQVPGWFISRSVQFLEKDRQLYPNGNFNLGLAHGIPGPLSLLSLSLLKGVKVKGQEEAMQLIIEWILRWKQEDEFGPYWYDRISFEEEVGLVESFPHRRREAWCYGTPGVARSLYLAGKALNDTSLKKLANDAFKAVHARPEKLKDLNSPTFCHGMAGLLQMTWVMARDTGDQKYQDELEKWLDRLHQRFDSSLPFGYQDLEPTTVGYRGLNKAGLLEGVSGIALTLLTVGSLGERAWDQAFLIQ